MITFKEEIVITHNDPNADVYRKELKAEDGWHIEADTIATSYTRETICRTMREEKKEWLEKR